MMALGGFRLPKRRSGPYNAQVPKKTMPAPGVLAVSFRKTGLKYL
jgi:hypothetical protein